MNEIFLGIEIGGTKLQIVAGEGSGAICHRSRFEVDRHQGGPGIRRQIELALPDLLPRYQPCGITVGFGGPVDWRTGHIARSHQIEGWTDFDLAGWLQSVCGMPVGIDNDANMAALGEAQVGAGRGYNPVFYVTLGSGVGGGLVVDGAIYHGAKPGEAEIGHVRLDREGTVLEGCCSGWAVDAKIRKLKDSGSSSLLCQSLSPERGGEAKYLPAALEHKDAEAWRILEETADDLAFGLSHVTHLFHPEVIVLGGGLSLIGEPWRAAVGKALPAFIMGAFRPGPEIRLAALGEDAVPVGCLWAARQRQRLER